MRKISLCAILCVCGITTAISQFLSAKIKIDIDRKIGDIDRNLFGNFTEHLGRCIYGGIYDPASPQANADGFRNDVIKATKALGVSIVRWPGGNFSSGYHWMDGIGPLSGRPRRKDLAWGDIETNKVGTDEFLKFARASGVTPYICVNLGTGTWDEARNWVEYCNAPAGLFFSDLRAKNGHREPYGVKYWGLGNEMDGSWQMGHRDADSYSKFALEAAKLMKWSDDSIKLIASGSSDYGDGWINWNRTILTNMHDAIDYISLHHYSGNYHNDYYQFMNSTLFVESVIRITEGLINEVRTRFSMQKPIYIAFDEYNVWYRAGSAEKLEEHYNMEDALVVALYLNTFIRHANVVKMANLAQLVNVIAPMMITDDKLWVQTIYFPLQLFENNCKGYAIDALVQSDTYDTKDNKQVPYLDVSSSFDETTRLITINVINKNESKPIRTSIINQSGHLEDDATVYELNSQSVKDENSAGNEKIRTNQQELKINGDNFDYTFPPHSFTMIKLRLIQKLP